MVWTSSSLSDVYQMNMYARSWVRVTAFLLVFNTKHTRTEKCKFVTEQEAHSLNFLSKEVPSPVKTPIRFLASASHVNNSNDHHQM